MSIPRWICIRVPNLVPISPDVPLVSFPHLLMCDPLTPSKYPLMFLADVYSQSNLHTCVKFGPDRSSGLEAFPDLCINDPLTSMPVGYREVNCFSRCPFPDEYAYVCQLLSRSVQWFATGPSVTAKVSSVFSRCWRWLVQKHAQKTTFIHTKL